MLFAEVILPLALEGVFTYLIPDVLLPEIAVGKRVAVQFGEKRQYAALVCRVTEATTVPQARLKPILAVLDTEPIIAEHQLQFWQWIADYYMCSMGEVMAAALPTAFKLTSETLIYLNPSFGHDYSLLSDAEYMVAEALTLQHNLSLIDIQNIVNRKNVFYLVKSLLEKGVVQVEEQLNEKYKPKKTTFIALHEQYEDEATWQNLFTRLEKAPKQIHLLLVYLQAKNQSNELWHRKSDIISRAEATPAAMKALLDKQVFTEEERIVSRLRDEAAVEADSVQYELSVAQQKALASIDEQWQNHSVILMHGVTSSGKTQLYISLIEQAIAEGKQVLYLLPEIALTTQMIGRLRAVFGTKIGVYHSKFNDQERIEIWQKVQQREYKVVVGARSALFLPFQNLGLVVIDEEHDGSYKQHDPAPRYHARDAALYLAHLSDAKAIIGSATPSVESYYHAQQQKYGLVVLNERYGGVLPPKIEVVNTYWATQQQAMKSHFTTTLLQAMTQALEQQEQVILFRNRRGYSAYLLCQTCAWIPRCTRCDVSLTYHKHNNELRCHYCHFKRKTVEKCDACGSTNLHLQGVGTEKIEDEIQVYFPKARVARLDVDVAQTKRGFEAVISDFQNRRVDILVGTQMITKGLDFESVSIVGILNADQLWFFPDFRAVERAFQLMLQVSGRAGRRQKQGQVVIQTADTRHRVLQWVMNNDYSELYAAEIAERQRYNYPPFCRLTELTLKHKNKDLLNQAAFQLTKYLKTELDNTVAILGPAAPLVSYINLYHLRTILIKIPRSTAATSVAKKAIRKSIEQLHVDKQFGSIIVQIDVDCV